MRLKVVGVIMALMADVPDAEARLSIIDMLSADAKSKEAVERPCRNEWWGFGSGEEEGEAAVLKE